MPGMGITNVHESIAVLVGLTRGVLSSIRRYHRLDPQFYSLQSATPPLVDLAVDCPTFQALVGRRPALQRISPLTQ